MTYRSQEVHLSSLTESWIVMMLEYFEIGK